MSGHADTIRRYIGKPLGPDIGSGNFVGPNTALAALDALEAERDAALDALAPSQIAADEWATRCMEAERERDAARAERDRLRDALEVYANPQHWGICRDDLNHRVVAWIGSGAEKAGMPDAMEVARAALAEGTPG